MNNEELKTVNKINKEILLLNSNQFLDFISVKKNSYMYKNNAYIAEKKGMLKIDKTY